VVDPKQHVEELQAVDVPPQYDEHNVSGVDVITPSGHHNQDQKIAAITTATGESPVECRKPYAR
jgi:hypothetical protein